MKINTFTIVCGTGACDAKCPFCVSKMTGRSEGVAKDVNWQNFRTACRLVQLNHVSTALITGKGEPTLCPEAITNYLVELGKYSIPFVELQTNGKRIARNELTVLPLWRELGLNTIAISAVHWVKERNAEIYGGEHFIMSDLVKKLHDHGFSVRLTVMMMQGYIDGPARVDEMIAFCANNEVEQLTLRPIRRPIDSRDKKVAKFVDTHTISRSQEDKIVFWLRTKGTLVMTLDHGGLVYDVGGQNVCLSDCLTIKPASEDIRQVIFFPDGHLRYDWRFKGAILL